MTDHVDAVRWAVWNVPGPMPSRARLVLLALAEHVDIDTGEAYPSQRRLTAMVYGTDAGYDRRRLAVMLSWLAEHGHVTDTGRTKGRGVAVYSVHPGGVPLAATVWPVDGDGLAATVGPVDRVDNSAVVPPTGRVTGRVTGRATGRDGAALTERNGSKYAHTRTEPTPQRDTEPTGAECQGCAQLPEVCPYLRHGGRRPDDCDRPDETARAAS